MSHWATAIVAENTAVIQPTHMTKVSTGVVPPSTAPAVNNGNIRPTMNTPAATIVAAWISALTGVGPSIASGNHTCNGNWALLPIAPKNSNSAMNPAIEKTHHPCSIARASACSRAP